MSVALSIQVADREDDIYIPVATAAAFSGWESAARALSLRWIPLLEQLSEIDAGELRTLIAEFEAVREQFKRDRERIMARRKAVSRNPIKQALDEAASRLVQERPEIQDERIERAEFIVRALTAIDPNKVEAIAVL